MSLSIHREHMHGYSKHKLYGKITDMHQRCYNENAINYCDYGAKGVTVCDEWMEDKASFVEWGLANGWKDGLEIDRVDNEKGYCPENCRFVTKQFNRANTRLIRSNNNSGYRGVHHHTQNDCFTAHIRYSGKIKRKSGFKTALAGALYRDAYVIAKGYALPLNFPQLAKVGG